MNDQIELEKLLAKFQQHIYVMQARHMVAKKALQKVLERSGEPTQVAAEALDKLDELETA